MSVFESWSEYEKQSRRLRRAQPTAFWDHTVNTSVLVVTNSTRRFAWEREHFSRSCSSLHASLQP